MRTLSKELLETLPKRLLVRVREAKSVVAGLMSKEDWRSLAIQHKLEDIEKEVLPTKWQKL